MSHTAKATAMSINEKITELNKWLMKWLWIVNDYFSQANKIMFELKTNIDPSNIQIPDVILPGAVAQQCEKCWSGG
jgi:hypothetical protein